MHGQTIKYWYDGGNCTSAPYVAQKLGLFEECGIQTECLNGTALLKKHWAPMQLSWYQPHRFSAGSDHQRR